MNTLEGLRCATCRTAALKDGPAGPVCAACGSPVRIESGIPVLAPHWHAVQAEVEAARDVRPNWYQTEQPPEQSSPWRHHLRKRREYVQRAIRKYLERSGKTRSERLLDLGCGDGNNLVWLREFTDAAYGSDYNLVRLSRASAQNSSATIFAADILEFPADDGTFEIVFFNHVIEHISEDVRALREVQRILKPGGLLVLGTPNEGAWWWQLAYRRDPESLATTDHVHFYTGETIAAKMRAAGLSVIETHHLGWGPPDWRLDGRIRKHKLVDDAFTLIGRALIPRQASSLYLLATRG